MINTFRETAWLHHDDYIQRDGSVATVIRLELKSNKSVYRQHRDLNEDRGSHRVEVVYSRNSSGQGTEPYGAPQNLIVIRTGVDQRGRIRNKFHPIVLRRCVMYNLSFSTCFICFVSTVLGTNSLSCADVPLNNKETNKHA